METRTKNEQVIYMENRKSDNRSSFIQFDFVAEDNNDHSTVWKVEENHNV